MTEKEIFISIKGFEGLYEISNMGQVKSLEKYFKAGSGKTALCKVDEKIYSLSVGSNGYQTVNLYNNGFRKGYTVHRLVAMHFIPNPENKRCVNHINGDKTDNRVLNLEWATHSENNKHAFLSGLKVGAWKGIKGEMHPNSIPVIQYDLAGNIIKEYPSASQAQLELGYIKGSITQSIKKNRAYKGHVWKLKPLYGARSTDNVRG